MHADIQPDLTILLDAPAEIGIQRAIKRGEIDRMESEEISFYERVREGYICLAKQYSDRFVVVDANQPLDLVQKEIIMHLKNVWILITLSNICLICCPNQLQSTATALYLIFTL